MRSRLPRILLAAVTIASFAVTGTGRADPIQDAAGVCDPIDAASCLLPWPNDLFTIPDATTATGLRVDVSALGTPRNAAGIPVRTDDLNRQDGFSPGSLIVTQVPGIDSPAALAATNPPTNTNIARSYDADSPIVVYDATARKRWPVWAELDRSLDLNGATPSPDRTGLLIRPAVNFAESHRYIVALRNLKDKDGKPLQPGAAFVDFRAGRGAQPRQTHFNKDIFAPLADAGIARDDLYLAWDFTVESERSLTERILSIRDDALAKLGDTTPGDGKIDGSAPQFVIDNVTQNVPCGVSIGVPPVHCSTSQQLDARVYRHVQGYVLVPCYLDLPGCPPGAQFHYLTPTDSIPTPIPGNYMAANFQCNIPADAARGTKFRPSLYGHGLFGTANEVNSGKIYDLAQYGLMLCASDEIGMAQTDIPNAVTVLADLSRFSTLPDRLQQGLINFIYLGRAMVSSGGFCSDPDFQVNGSCVIDTSHLYYDGGSQGAIFGGALTAVDPDFTRAHLGVAGMNYSTLLTRSSDFPTYAQVLYRTYTDPLERQLLFSMVQNLWDRGEADGYAEHMTTDPLPGTPAHDVLMTIAFGDHQVTNWASEVEMRTIGASLREPTLDPGRYPGPVEYWGIDRIASFPYSGHAAAVMADVGPLRPCAPPATACSGGFAGTNPPPIENVANDSGVDPHGPDWSEGPEGFKAIGEWLAPDGVLNAPCGARPCYLAGWTGP